MIDFPWNVTLPVSGLSSPEITRSVVDLPAPFAPSSVTIEPSATDRLMLWSATTGP